MERVSVGKSMALAAAMAALQLKGVSLEPDHFTPLRRIGSGRRNIFWKPSGNKYLPKRDGSRNNGYAAHGNGAVK